MPDQPQPAAVLAQPADELIQVTSGRRESVLLAVTGGPAWRKSSRSGGTGAQCVEAAANQTRVAIRDSKHPDGPRLAVPARAWEAFTGRIRSGALDT